MVLVLDWKNKDHKREDRVPDQENPSRTEGENDE